MSRISELFLRVYEADEADYGKSLIRIHGSSKPQDINWGDNINVSLNKKNWITSKLEPAGDIGSGKIYIDIHQRGLLSRDIVGSRPAKVGEACNFYVRKASSKVLLYIVIVAIVIIAGAFLVSSLIQSIQ
jgi:hypothetical protein